jgi:hypothetical protein
MKIEKLSGVRCGNFGVRQHDNSWCRNAWHGKCYVQHKLDDFPVLGQQDLDASLIGESFLEDDDPKRFKKVETEII